MRSGEKWAVGVVLALTLVVAVYAVVRAEMGPIEYQEMSASGYIFRLEDGTGTEVFSVDDNGAMAQSGGLVDVGGGTGGTADGDNDLLVAGDLEVDDTLDVDGDIDLDGDGFDVNITSGGSIDTDGATNLSTSTGDITVDAEAGSLVLIGSEAAADSIHLDANDTVTSGLNIDVGSVSGATFDGGLLDIGGGTCGVADGDNDVCIAAVLEVDGELEADGNIDADADLDVDGTSNLDEVDIDGVTNLVVGTEHIGLVTIASATVITTANDGALFTVGDGEIWIVHDVYVNVTTNFDCTGNDCTMIIGDGNDTDGFCVLADAELQTTDAEGTGWQAGWQCQVAATIGVYGDENDGFVYAPSGADETIDVDVGGTDVAAGQATVYVVYTRIQ